MRLYYVASLIICMKLITIDNEKLFKSTIKLVSKYTTSSYRFLKCYSLLYDISVFLCRSKIQLK